MRSIEEINKMNKDAHRRFIERQRAQESAGTNKMDAQTVFCPVCENMLIVGNAGDVVLAEDDWREER